MRLWRYQLRGGGAGRRAFSIMEALIALGLIGTAGVALLAGLSSGFVMMRFARENLRATQIMLEKVETIRLYSWEQVTQTSPPFIPATFTAPYDPNAPEGSRGPTFQGTLTIEPISPSAMTSSYSNSMVQVTVRLTWQTGSLTRQREFMSYISRYGLQDYIF